MTVSKHSTYEIARANALETAAKLAAEQGYCVLLVRSFDEAVRVKKLLAEGGQGFGVQVVTMKEWLEESWELFGDGRVLVDPVHRALMVRRVLLDAAEAAVEAANAAESEAAEAAEAAETAEVADEPLTRTPGIVQLIGAIAKDALPAALRADQARFAGATLQVIKALRAYAKLLEGAELIELSQMADKLREGGLLAGRPVVCLAVPTTQLQDELLESLGASVFEVSLDQAVWEADRAAGAPASQAEEQDEIAAELRKLTAALYRPDFQNPVQSQGAVRFAYAAGPYAHDQLVTDQLVGALRDAAAEQPAGKPVRALYCASKPYQTFTGIADRLAEQGVSSSMYAYVPVTSTDFGRAWFNLMDFVATEGEPGTFDPAAIGDFALSAFSFMSIPSAQHLDQRVRGWRGQTVDEALTDLTAFAYDGDRLFMSYVSAGRLGEALQELVSWMVKQISWPEAYRLLQVNAARAVRSVYDFGVGLHLPFAEMQEELKCITVPYSAAVTAEGEWARVEFQTLKQAGQEEVGSVDVLVMDDLTAQAYPLKDDRTATDEVMDSLGAYKPALKVEQLRQSFQQALRTPRTSVLLARCLSDSDAKEQRPAALLEELVDCYRSDPQNPSEVDKIMGLTSALMAHAQTLGEDRLSQILDPRQAEAQAAAVLVEPPSLASLSSSSKARVLLPGSVEGVRQEWPVVSPSAIEKYLQCPYKWFAESRLGASNGIDAGFDALSRGLFAHAILEQTHDALRREGLRRVTEENAGYAKQLLGQLFDAQLEKEPFSYESTAYVPLTQSQMVEAEALKLQLQAYLDWEAGFLPDFAPQGAEISFGEDAPFEYAGIHVRGRLDRLDVDPYGRAVVVDYKGSVGSNYRFAQKIAEEGVTPQRVQTLIYAQMVRRKLGVVPVGALYVSYGKNLGASGAYDAQILHPTRDLCGINAEKCASASFQEDLDRVEEELSRVVKRMAAGVIDPDPCSKSVCDYCPVAMCPKRGAEAGRE